MLPLRTCVLASSKIAKYSLGKLRLMASARTGRSSRNPRSIFSGVYEAATIAGIHLEGGQTTTRAAGEQAETAALTTTAKNERTKFPLALLENSMLLSGLLCRNGKDRGDEPMLDHEHDSGFERLVVEAMDQFVIDNLVADHHAVDQLGP